MTHVLIHTLAFPPDNTSTAHLMGDLAEDFVLAGHQVTVLTTQPHNNDDLPAEARQPLHPVLGKFLKRSHYAGADVLHTLMLKKRSNKGARLLGWSLFHVISIVVGFSMRGPIDVILAPSPPLTMGVTAWLIGLRHQAKVIYNVQELYPDLAIELGVISNRGLISLLYRLESFVYRKSNLVTVISERIRDAVIRKGQPKKKVALIPNWVDVDEFRPSQKSNQFSRKHGIDEAFVVSYAGNIGLAQCFDELIGAARLLEAVEDVRFLFVGGGVEKNRVEDRVKDLTNVVVLPHQPYERMPDIYAACELSYVPLPSGLGAAAMPSKVYKIMSSGRAVLALTSEDSDLAILVLGAECGFVVAPGSSRALADVILQAYQDRQRLQALGKAGRRYVEESFSRQAVVGQYLCLIDSITS